MIINPNTGRPYAKNYFRDYARGKPCLVRIAAECGHACASQETTVLCHLTMSGLKGVSMKLNDLLGAWGCYTCHGILDGAITPRGSIPSANIKQWHHDGVARTLDRLVKDGVLAYEL
ncbi:MAG: nuclease domain-containing protein [Pseudohongiellaceae bacterium]